MCKVLTVTKTEKDRTASFYIEDGYVLVSCKFLVISGGGLWLSPPVFLFKARFLSPYPYVAACLKCLTVGNSSL